MTYTGIDGRNYEIDISGNEVEVKPWEGLKETNPDGEPDPYQLYPHCPYNLGTRLIHVKNSLWKCGACGNHFTVSKKSYV
jgi:hypothetical protein